MYVFARLSVSSLILWKVQHFAANRFWVESYISKLPNYIPGCVKPWMCIWATYFELVIIVYKLKWENSSVQIWFH